MTATCVIRTLSADLLTPVGAYLLLAADSPPSMLLESIEGGTARGRYSVIALAPDLVWRCRAGQAEIAHHGGAFTPDPRPALESLRATIDDARIDLPRGLPPMTGGMFGYLGWDMVRLFEHLPGTQRDVLGVPDAILMRPGLFAIFDHVRDELTLAAPCYDGAAGEEAANRRLDHAQAALSRPVTRPARVLEKPRPIAAPRSNVSREDFIAAILRGKAHIAAGDVFQIVASQRFSVTYRESALSLYRALRRINPAPFLFHLDFEAFQVVGSSPEILVRLRDGEVTIRPLAGTRRRGATPEEDAALEAELRADPKERAEHLMLIDLARNDVGRVAEIGSVRVPESFMVERFSHVMHLSSTVTGRLRPRLSALDALMAGFPAGTLSGAPKIRAMEILDELEPDRRGLYGGCIGYFAADGSMDTCIGLRMGVVRDGVLHVQAGAGVVHDSVPEAEFAETEQKASALFRAAESSFSDNAAPV